MPMREKFYPDGAPAGEVFLTIDEYETIRLIDLEGNTQEECSRQMQVARTTVQGIYNEARHKLADAIVNGKELVISGGDYRLCDFYEKKCGRGCGRRCHRQQLAPSQDKPPALKGDTTMKIAVTYENGQIFQHFGHTGQFKIYEVENGKVKGSQVVDTMGSGHGALAGFLRAHQVDTLICGGIGGGAQAALREAGITLYGGASGSADEAVAALLENRLLYNPSVKCSHHGHEHGEHACGDHGHSGHACGDHGCGN